MIKGVRLSEGQLKERLGVSARVAVRVAALLARGVEVSEGFLRSLARKPEAEKFLLSQKLLRRTSLKPPITPDDLRQIACEHLAPDAAPVLVVHHDGSRVIALPGEADAGPTSVLTRGDSPVPALFSPVSTAMQLISPEESEKLFPPEETARLKMIILTSADLNAKVEAIRRLAISPLNPNQKGTVLIHALSDQQNTIRVEAAEALTALGLDPVIAQAARSFGNGNAKQRTHAAERLGVLAERVAEGEISVILALLAGAINSEESTAVKVTLIQSFKGTCGIVAANRSHVAALLRLLIRELEGAAEALYRPVREILGEVGRHAPATMTELVMQELSTIKARPLRRLLFGVLAMFDVPEENRPELAELAVADLKGSAAPEEECQGIGNMLCDWGMTAIQPLLASLPAAEDAQRMYITRLLDEIVYRRDAQPPGAASRPAEGAAEQVASAFLNLLRVSSKHVCMPIMESRVITHPGLSPELKQKIAAELLAGLTHFANPRIKEVICSAVVRLGEPALPAVKALLVEETNDIKLMSVCQVAAEIVESIGEPDRTALADHMLEVYLQQWHNSQGRKGYLAETIGRLAVASSATPGGLKAIVDELKAAAVTMPEPFGVLVALGHLNGSDRLEITARFDIVQTFFDLLDATLPELTDKVAPAGDDEEVHLLGREVTAYTEMVPACLEGLGKTYFNVPVKSLRTKVADFLIGKWNATSNWTTIWGPDAVGILLRVLGQIARDPATDSQVRARIVEALARRLEFGPVVDELAGILSVRDSSPRVGAAACKIASELLRRTVSRRENERLSTLRTLGTIAARTNLGKDPEAARKLRERVLQVLYEGVKQGHSDAIRALEQMKDCPALPAAAREEIRIRLQIIADDPGQKETSGTKH